MACRRTEDFTAGWKRGSRSYLGADSQPESGCVWEEYLSFYKRI